MSGFPAATSGVEHPQPKTLPPALLGSAPKKLVFDEPNGLAILGVLKMLKISQRNSAPKRSLNVNVLNIEKSTFLKPESRKMFRPILPKVPIAGGVITELPDAKQPVLTRLLVPPPPAGWVPWAFAAHIAAHVADWGSG